MVEHVWSDQSSRGHSTPASSTTVDRARYKLNNSGYGQLLFTMGSVSEIYRPGDLSIIIVNCDRFSLPHPATLCHHLCLPITSNAVGLRHPPPPPPLNGLFLLPHPPPLLPLLLPTAFTAFATADEPQPTLTLWSLAPCQAAT